MGWLTRESGSAVSSGSHARRQRTSDVEGFRDDLQRIFWLCVTKKARMCMMGEVSLLSRARPASSAPH